MEKAKPFKMREPPQNGETLTQRRMSICNECEYKTKFGTCAKCGCILALKTRFEYFSCPIGKW